MNEARYRAVEDRLWRSYGLEPDEQRVPLGESGIEIRVLGFGAGPPVLYIHGGSSSGANWAPLVAALDGFRHLVIDRPGCGLSDPLPSGFATVAEMEVFADGFVGDVLDGLGLQSAAVVATSLGGFFAIRSAAAEPSRIERLFEIGWPMGAPVGQVPVSMRIAAVPGLGKLMARLPAPRAAVRSILGGLGMKQALRDGRISEEFLDWYVALLRNTPTMRNEIDVNPPVLGALRGVDPDMLHADETLAGLAMPVAFVWGDDDPFGGGDVARAFASRVPGAELTVLPSTGHAPWVERAEEVAALAAEFLTPDG